MANDLTGDFDVVAQFTVPAANRVLAAMHRGGRVPHSWTLRVDDYNHIHVSPGTVATETGVRSITDAFGGAVTDPAKAVNVSYKPTSEAAIHSDFVVNQPKPAPKFSAKDTISSDPNHIHIPTPAELERASHLNGVAQVQLGAPTISFGRSHTSIVVHTPVMARYTADQGTFDIPNFLHGEFQTTIEVQQASSSAGNFINIKLASPDGRASFAPTWVSPTWDSEPAQLAVINKALVNSLKNSFEPSSTKVPASIPIMNFKTMQDDSQAALAVMMDIPGGVLAGEVLAAALLGIGTGVPDPSTVTNIFLGQGDDFAMAIRSDDIISAFFGAVNDAVPGRQDFTTTTHAEGPYGIGSYTFHTFTTITTDDPVVELQAGQILVTIQVHVHFSNDSSYVPSPSDFDFPVIQAFNLVLNGGQVTLQPLGNLQVNVPGSVNSSIKDFVTKNAQTQFTNAWNSASSTVQAKVGSSLSANSLQGFLQSMMNPSPSAGSQPVEQVNPKLSYTWYEINPSGIVLHGTLDVPAWSKPHVEFDFHVIPGLVVLSPARSEYNALKSWVPGGTLQEFIWTQDDTPIDDDRHRFVFSRGSHAPLSRVCLTVKGSRITASGPIAYQTVTAKTLFCGWRLTVNARNLVGLAIAAERPTVALTRKSTAGGMEVIGHTSPWAPDDAAREDATNLIVHFPDAHSLDRIELLPRVLQQKEHQETGAAIIVVVTPEQLSKIKPVDGVVFSDDEKNWARALPLHHRPATFVIDTEGDVIWQHQGPLSGDELVAGLTSHLPKNGSFSSRVLGPALRVGHPVPNFLFEYSPGNELTLRKLYGRPVVLVFWRSTSAASLEAIRDLECAFKNSGSRAPVLLAINDGESEGIVRHAAKGIKAIVVPDPARDIAAACGINLWPTSVYLDKAGLVTDICHGRFCGQTEKSPVSAGGEEYRACK